MVFSLLFCFSSRALKESDISVVYQILDKKSFYQMGEFPGEKGVKIRYARFGNQRGEKGSLVFVSGRAENLFKYIELFYDLHQEGWSPIYTYDHRGQGFSSRLTSKANRADVENYSHYRKDLKSFMNLVLKDSLVDKEKLFMIAHSMGGLIAVDYLQTYKEPEFQALVLSSPMFRIQIKPFLS